MTLRFYFEKLVMCNDAGFFPTKKSLPGLLQLRPTEVGGNSSLFLHHLSIFHVVVCIDELKSVLLTVTKMKYARTFLKHYYSNFLFESFATNIFVNIPKRFI